MFVHKELALLSQLSKGGRVGSLQAGQEVAKKSFSPLLNRKSDFPSNTHASSRTFGFVKTSSHPTKGPFGKRREPSLGDAFLQITQQDTTVVQFSDLLYYQNAVREDREGINLVKTIAERVKPNLVVFTGDILDGRHCKDYRAFRNAIQPLVDLQIPWTYVPGKPKHFARKDLLNLFSLPLCASRGATSFSHTLKVGLSQIYLLDTYGDVGAHVSASPDDVDLFPQRIPDWYTQKPPQGEISLAFYHSSTKKPILPGGRTESFTYNSGFFSADQDLRGLFTGGDRWNDLVSESDGVWLCHGQVKSGFTQSRDDQTPLKKERWGRVIRYDPSSSLLSTWVENKKGVERNSIISRRTIAANSAAPLHDELD